MDSSPATVDADPLSRALPPQFIAEWYARGVRIRRGISYSHLTGESVLLVELMPVDPTKTIELKRVASMEFSHKFELISYTTESTGVRVPLCTGKVHRVELRRRGEPPEFVVVVYGERKEMRKLAEPPRPEEFLEIVRRECMRMLHSPTLPAA